MAKRTVRKPIPRDKPEKMIEIAQKLIRKNKEMGEDSPLKSLDMTLFEENFTVAVENREQSIALRRESEALMQKSKNALGTDIGQNMNTPDTVYNFIALCRDLLSVTYRGNEEQLSTWGFDIVVGSVIPHEKKNKENN